MKKEILVLYDKDQSYIEKMQHFFMQKDIQPFRICVYTKKEALDNLLKEESVKILIAAESVYETWMETVLVPFCFLLTETGQITETKLKHVDKYQSMNCIWGIILNVCAMDQEFKIAKSALGKRGKCISFYSPEHRVLQTSSSICMSRLLGEKGKTLYINLEPNSGLNYLFTRSAQNDLMDLLYFYECNKEKMFLKLDAMSWKEDSFYMLPSVRYCKDFEGVDGTVWLGFLEEILQYGKFEYVVLDLSDAVHGLLDILEESDMIIHLKRPEREMSQIDIVKERQYQDTIMREEESSILKKEITITFPAMDTAPGMLCSTGNENRLMKVLKTQVLEKQEWY
ncbi:MAG: hypothetical protein PHP50_06940 [Lachnospiraceae bacterium]|nr:hypothetical protein [Lachnospiraceae bacterium]